MRAILRGPEPPYTPLSSAQFSIEVIGDELAGFVSAGAELDDLPTFQERLGQYRMAVERAMIERFIESASRWSNPR